MVHAAHPGHTRVSEMRAFIPCRVYPGQFSSEYAVEATQQGGAPFSLFVPTRYVEPVETPTRDHTVEGRLQVIIVQDRDGVAIVRLPRESFESGRFVVVSSDQLEQVDEPVEA